MPHASPPQPRTPPRTCPRPAAPRYRGAAPRPLSPAAGGGPRAPSSARPGPPFTCSHGAKRGRRPRAHGAAGGARACAGKLRSGAGSQRPAAGPELILRGQTARRAGPPGGHPPRAAQPPARRLPGRGGGAGGAELAARRRRLQDKGDHVRGRAAAPRSPGAQPRTPGGGGRRLRGGCPARPGSVRLGPLRSVPPCPHLPAAGVQLQPAARSLLRLLNLFFFLFFFFSSSSSSSLLFVGGFFVCLFVLSLKSHARPLPARSGLPRGHRPSPPSRAQQRPRSGEFHRGEAAARPQLLRPRRNTPQSL